MEYLGKTSFSLFLVHFPTCLVVSAWLTRAPLTPTEALVGRVGAWTASMLVSVLPYHTVELPGLRAVQRSTRRQREPLDSAALS